MRRNQKSMTERGDEMIALIAGYGGVFGGTVGDLADEMEVCDRYAGKVMCFIRTHPSLFNDVTIEWNSRRAGYGLIVSGVSAFADDGDHVLSELVRVYGVRIGNDHRSLNMVRALRRGKALPGSAEKVLRATEKHLEGTVLQAEALLGLIG